MIKHASGYAVFSLVGGIAHATVSAGVVTADRLGGLGRAAVGALDGLTPLVYLVDCRRPVWALRTEDLDAFCHGAHSALLAPAALVVPDLYLPMFRSHAWNVAQGGVIRKIFTDYAIAARWCQMRIGLHRQAQIVP